MEVILLYQDLVVLPIEVMDLLQIEEAALEATIGHRQDSDHQDLVRQADPDQVASQLVDLIAALVLATPVADQAEVQVVYHQEVEAEVQDLLAALDHRADPGLLEVHEEVTRKTSHENSV